jgi:hypothetical protein
MFLTQMRILQTISSQSNDWWYWKSSIPKEIQQLYIPIAFGWWKSNTASYSEIQHLSIPWYCKNVMFIIQICEFRNQNTVKLHLSRWTGMASHLDMQKIQIIGILFENRLHQQFGGNFKITIFSFLVFSTSPTPMWELWQSQINTAVVSW